MGRRQRRRAQVDAQVRARLTEFANVLDARLHAELDRSRQAQLALIEAVRNLRNDIATRDNELALTLDRVGDLIEHSTERLEADRVERRALVEAVGNLARSLALADGSASPSASPRSRERLIGGTFFGGQPPTHVPDIDVVPDIEVDVDLTAEEHASERDAQPRSGWSRS
jgi:hypothetical protein